MKGITNGLKKFLTSGIPNNCKDKLINMIKFA